jgi:hypothetical protein
LNLYDLDSAKNITELEPLCSSNIHKHYSSYALFTNNGKKKYNKI